MWIFMAKKKKERETQILMAKKKKRPKKNAAGQDGMYSLSHIHTLCNMRRAICVSHITMSVYIKNMYECIRKESV